MISKNLHNGSLYIHTLIIFAFMFIAFPWFLLNTEELNLLKGNLPPSQENIFGTDSLGRDLLVRVSKNIYLNIVPIFLIVSVTHLSSIMLFTFLISRKTEIFFGPFISKTAGFIYSFPLPILVLLLGRFSGIHSVQTIWSVLTIFFFAKTWLLLTNAYSFDIKKTYWKSYLLAGGKKSSLVLQYGILGAWVEILICSFCNHFQQGVIIETIFSYLGFGVVEPVPSFGNMISAHFEQIFSAKGTVLPIVAVCLYICLSVPKSVLHFLIRRKPHAVTQWKRSGDLFIKP